MGFEVISLFEGYFLMTALVKCCCSWTAYWNFSKWFEKCTLERRHITARVVTSGYARGRSLMAAACTCRLASLAIFLQSPTNDDVCTYDARHHRKANNARKSFHKFQINIPWNHDLLMLFIWKNFCIELYCPTILCKTKEHFGPWARAKRLRHKKHKHTAWA